jgi:hypothetical protein
VRTLVPTSERFCTGVGLARPFAPFAFALDFALGLSLVRPFAPFAFALDFALGSRV